MEDGEELASVRTIDNPFIWESDRERQMRLLMRTFDSVASDICALRDKAKGPLKDCDLHIEPQ